MTHQMIVSRYTIGRGTINGKGFRTLVHHGTCEIFGENLDFVWNITRILLYGICLVPVKFPQYSPSQKVLVLIDPAWYPRGPKSNGPWVLVRCLEGRYMIKEERVMGALLSADTTKSGDGYTCSMLGRSIQ